ncbi:hypothetical protein R6V09_30100 [Streptomyces sp. W16]|uniref:hypothetical protein n=1 Tax=Streptomyces sp. W16 TaxID=3076631 RepID=UPI00295A5DDA|nr:hypothetical protein [Streptomyces sp. W16]MDV9174348.1 hypothetical protein [Streptomyces sp. W16]
MAGSSSGIVAGLTVAAVATVGFLAYQASASVPAGLGSTARASAPPAVATSKAPRDRKNPAALPAGSGRGERVVYSLDDDRVWLVATNNKVNRTFKVTPGTVDPTMGSYWVTSRSNAVTGTDGTPIQHVVRFTSTGGLAIGFSAAVSGATQEPDPTVKSGGIRESVEDGAAMWEFATIGQSVVVIH